MNEEVFLVDIFQGLQKGIPSGVLFVSGKKYFIRCAYLKKASSEIQSPEYHHPQD